MALTNTDVPFQWTEASQPCLEELVPEPVTRRSELAIIGLGPWGLCVLERAVSRARITGRPVLAHVIEPGPPGGGVYTLDQPDFLILNNPCGQLSLHAVPDGSNLLPYGKGLFEWATSEGYRWVGHDCLRDPAGEPIKPTDYLPRRVMGEYLNWFYQKLVTGLPPSMKVVHHSQAAVDIIARPGGGESVILEDGSVVSVDHVVLTSGHTANRDSEPADAAIGLEAPYPIDSYSVWPGPGRPVAISGMGLVAFDVLVAFTVGRGGSFESAGGDRLVYHPSGREPVVYMYSRSGNPYCAKSAAGTDPTGDYQPVIATREAFAGLRSAAVDQGCGVDFRNQVLPLILAEMRVRYYCHAANRSDGPAAAEQVRAHIARAWADGDHEAELESLASEYGPFDPILLLFPETSQELSDSAAYETWVTDLVARDLDDACAPGGSAAKAAAEATRILRDEVRSVIEFGGLGLESYRDFQTNIRSRINRIEAGPPPLRSAQLLALMEAGIVRVPFGPSPILRKVEDGVEIRSTALGEDVQVVVDVVVRGHLDLPTLAGTASPLLSRLYDVGRLTEMHYGDTCVGSVSIDGRFHPISDEGEVQEGISVLGVLTEGSRYFTHFLPSPRSRLRAVLDAQSCAEAVIG